MRGDPGWLERLAGRARVTDTATCRPHGRGHRQHLACVSNGSEGKHQLYRSSSDQPPRPIPGDWTFRPTPPASPITRSTSGCTEPGEGWAGGPSRRDAQRPSGGRSSRRGCRGWGRMFFRWSTSRDPLSPHRVRRWSAKRPEMADVARQQPTVKVLVRTDFQSQPTAPNRPSDDFARRGLGVRFPSSPHLSGSGTGRPAPHIALTTTARRPSSGAPGRSSSVGRVSGRGS
jgi:hypothetical protein